MKKLENLLRYLKDSTDLKLTLSTDNIKNINGYIDVVFIEYS